MTKPKNAIIIGAGPGGLTAAFELITRSGIKPIILEKSGEIGGLSRTVKYKGNRLDIGGHRFFSKSKRVMKWWESFMPVENENNRYKIDTIDKVLLIRKRLSSIFYLRRYFDYPISLNFRTIKNLGFLRILKITFSYGLINLLPKKEEKNLEDFFINRFGKELYTTFFKDYTEKVWGKPCNEISAEWGAQRIKGLSILKAILHAFKQQLKPDFTVNQTNTETSLIERFLYPKLGPGQLWEEVASAIATKGGQIVFQQQVTSIYWPNQDKVEVTVYNPITRESVIHTGDYLFSSMPIQELINCMGDVPPKHVRDVSNGLEYRDFITVGLLVKQLKRSKVQKHESNNQLIEDNWIYIQENDVNIGRLQIFNNWSPYLLKDPSQVWLGLEYFCNEHDHLWTMDENKFISFAIDELVQTGIIELEDVIDSTIVKVPKAYPAYFGTYPQLQEVIAFTKSFKNMYLIGRNGMHKYNNQDHSMLTAMLSVDHIIDGGFDKDIIWTVNTEHEYHESIKHK